MRPMTIDWKKIGETRSRKCHLTHPVFTIAKPDWCTPEEWQAELARLCEDVRNQKPQPILINNESDDFRWMNPPFAKKLLTPLISKPKFVGTDAADTLAYSMRLGLSGLTINAPLLSSADLFLDEPEEKEDKE